MMVGSAAPYLDEVEMSLNIYLEHIHTHCFDSFNHTSKLSNDFLLETSNTLKMVRREREKERESCRQCEQRVAVSDQQTALRVLIKLVAHFEVFL